MDHLQVQQYLDEYVNGELSPSDRDEVERHLSACEHCRKWTEMIRLQKATFAALEPQLEIPELSAAFVDRLAPRRRFSFARLVPIAAALVLVMGLGVLSLRFMGLSGASSDAAAPEAAMDATITSDTSATYATRDEGGDAAAPDSDSDDALALDDTAHSDGSPRAYADDAAVDTADTPESNSVVTEDSDMSDDAAGDTAGGDMEEASSIQQKDISFSTLTDTSAIGGADAPTSLLVAQEGASSFFVAHAAWLIPVGVGLVALVISGAVWLIVKRKY